MVVSSDPETYGQLKVYKYDGTLPAGPATVSAELSSNPSISPVITLLNQQGSRVILGQLQVVPVGKGLIWVQPLYIRDKVAQTTAERDAIKLAKADALATSSASTTSSPPA